ncbi:hypothetical protein HD597_000761 [Nonomuraea thailandensis]|uniref:Uncharacterized protein n=1 Tax=Nonomuraea thailandensis TaxID=1188745 RepID=A0A9X2K1P0_9ACTN|nr:hypothetical protein [Nonomuraea thailandensis]MCP2353741.1 hypothetical protein [Nonomuraea thailandensis]
MRAGFGKRRLHERLTAARDNSRFLDNRIAGLEAQLADQIGLDASGETCL